MVGANVMTVVGCNAGFENYQDQFMKGMDHNVI